MTPLEEAILRAVVYASLFDYPLTLDQVHATLVGVTSSPEVVRRALESSGGLTALIEWRDGFAFPMGRDDLIAERRRREARSQSFLRAHHRMLQLLCFVPFTRLVALSGSLAHLNLDEGGDVDLFVVTRGRRAWMVTVALILLARAIGRRRVACANFVTADTRLAVEPEDLFTANQIIHLKPLVGAPVLRAFFAANPFVARTYPNATPADAQPNLLPLPLRCLKKVLEVVLAPISGPIERASRRAYESHLRRRSPSWRSPQHVRLDDDRVKLHTQSHRESIMDRYARALDDAMRRADRMRPRAVGQRAH